MLKISEFSHLAHVSERMLRHYDERGLLKPAYVDPSTSYRYYMLKQLPRLNRLLALKDLGFTLEQIAPMLDGDLPAAQIRGMLRLKQAEIQQHVQAEQARLDRIEARLKHIECEGTPSVYDVVLKTIPEMLVATTSGVIPDDEDAGRIVLRLFDEILDRLAGLERHISRQRLLVWSNMDESFQEMHVEAAIPLTAPISTNEPVRVYELPHVPTMACVVHQGRYHDLPQAIHALYAWIEANGYKACGVGRELYLHGGTNLDNPAYITEIQLPIEKS
jgi:DNA-binding transcriptional MerR regulator